MGKPDHLTATPRSQANHFAGAKSQAEGIARSPAAQRMRNLLLSSASGSGELLDALACAINSRAPPIEACRSCEPDEFSGVGRCCTLIGGGRGNIIYAAAFYNTALVRYVDYMGQLSRRRRALPSLGQHGGDPRREQARRPFGEGISCSPWRFCLESSHTAHSNT